MRIIVCLATAIAAVQLCGLLSAADLRLSPPSEVCAAGTTGCTPIDIPVKISAEGEVTPDGEVRCEHLNKVLHTCKIGDFRFEVKAGAQVAMVCLAATHPKAPAELCAGKEALAQLRSGRTILLAADGAAAQHQKSLDSGGALFLVVQPKEVLPSVKAKLYRRR